MKEDRESRQQQEADEAFAELRCAHPDLKVRTTQGDDDSDLVDHDAPCNDLDRMAYSATGNNAALADHASKKEKGKVS